jgi:hypothetical protein
MATEEKGVPPHLKGKGSFAKKAEPKKPEEAKAKPPAEAHASEGGTPHPASGVSKMEITHHGGGKFHVKSHPDGMESEHQGEGDMKSAVNSAFPDEQEEQPAPQSGAPDGSMMSSLGDMGQ